jgi:hypothetical protein
MVPVTILAILSSRRSRHRADSIVTKGVVVKEFKVILDTDHRTRVAGERHHWKRSEHGVDRPAFESKLAQMRAVQE